MFRRKKQEDDLEDYALDPEDQALEDAELLAIIDAQLAAEAETETEAGGGDGDRRPEGPWDSEDAPDDEVQRIDLGSLRLPVPDGTEVRVDVGPDGEVVAATMVQGESSMQINVFAAPKRSGIWGEVRTEIAEALEQSGGKAEHVEGPYGLELKAQVPTEVPGQGAMLAPARFLGVDGPRWFLRALLTGPAATGAAAAVGLETVLRDVVVHRGGEAMAVRDALPLHLPRDVAEQAAAAAEAADAEGEQEGGGGLPMPERGPEITETR
ncbi:MAG: DUF3710 domain-containing protein [Frankiaceae bacterium]|nr:DUF3710 domain-containing protein [Frankiaceae bacterium]